MRKYQEEETLYMSIFEKQRNVKKKRKFYQKEIYFLID